jgi:cell division protein FtsL
MRIINICLVLGLVALACVIYQVKYQARGLDTDISTLTKQIDDEHDAIAVLRAEWSLLNRPERIERLARKYLKLEPAKPTQLVTLDAASDRDFGPILVTPGAPASDPAANSTEPSARGKVSVASAPAAKIERPVNDSAR